jgi:hypothetical protein
MLTPEPKDMDSASHTCLLGDDQSEHLFHSSILVPITAWFVLVILNVPDHIPFFYPGGGQTDCLLRVCPDRQSYPPIILAAHAMVVYFLHIATMLVFPFDGQQPQAAGGGATGWGHKSIDPRPPSSLVKEFNQFGMPLVYGLGFGNHHLACWCRRNTPGVLRTYHGQ